LMEYRRGRISQEYRPTADGVSNAEAARRCASTPMLPGRAGTMTHDYKRNGTLDLFTRGQATLDRITKSATHH
jgi:hypothetical protein